MGRLFRLTAEHGLRDLVAFADPQPRIIAGTMLLGGHLGHVYRVTRGRYLGRGTARTITILPDGTVLTARALQISCGEGCIGSMFTWRLRSRTRYVVD